MSHSLVILDGGHVTCHDCGVTWDEAHRPIAFDNNDVSIGE
jgi:hypothetical protein